MKAEQQRIEKELVTFENKLWGIEEPATTTMEPEKEVEKKATMSRTTSRTPRTTQVKTEEKSDKSVKSSTATVRTARQTSTPTNKSTASSQTLSVRRQRR